MVRFVIRWNILAIIISLLFPPFPYPIIFYGNTGLNVLIFLIWGPFSITIFSTYPFYIPDSSCPISIHSRIDPPLAFLWLITIKTKPSSLNLPSLSPPYLAGPHFPRFLLLSKKWNYCSEQNPKQWNGGWEWILFWFPFPLPLFPFAYPFV